MAEYLLKKTLIYKAQAKYQRTFVRYERSSLSDLKRLVGEPVCYFVSDMKETR